MISCTSRSRNALTRPPRALKSSQSSKGSVYGWRPKCERCLMTGLVARSASGQPAYEPSVHRRPFFPRQTQSQLFALTPDSSIAQSIQASQGGRLKMLLAQCAEDGHAARAIRLCAEMKKSHIRPDVSVYNWLIQACAKQGLADDCFAFLEDMELSNIEPTVDTYNYIIYAQRWNRYFRLEDILARMEKANIRPNTHTFHHIILCHTEAQNLEMCLQCFMEMSEYNISPGLKTAQAVIELASQLGHARLALDIAHAFEASSVRKLEPQDWVRILSASTSCLYEQGVLIAWQKVVGEHHVTPDEGMCIEVLHTAARHGLPDLALHAIETINSLSVPLEEHHLAPILEAFCKRKMLEDAFAIINLMRSHDIPVRPESALPILEYICDDIEQVDKAWGILENMHADGKAVDIISLNVLVHASARLGDLQRAIGVYKGFPSFGIKPSIETFNHILSGCISAGHKELGDKMLEELQRQGLVADATTFERTIILCLTQTTYEDAFFYLEEMKGAGHKPPLLVYEALIKKCVASEDERWKIAMEELNECGYVAPPQLVRFVSSRGKAAGRARWNGQDTGFSTELSHDHGNEVPPVEEHRPELVQN